MNRRVKSPRIPDIGMEVEVNTTVTWKQRVCHVLGYDLTLPLLFNAENGVKHVELIRGQEEGQWENCFWQISKCAHVLVDVRDFRGPPDFPVFPSVTLAVQFLIQNKNYIQTIFLHRGLHDIVKEEIEVSGNLSIIGCTSPAERESVVLRGYEKPVLHFTPALVQAKISNVTFESDKSKEVILVEGEGTQPIFENCTFRGIRDVRNVIVRVKNKAFPKFFFCTFHDARVGLYVNNSHVKCENCTFTRFETAVSLHSYQVPYFKFCKFYDCTRNAITIVGRAHGCFEFCQIFDCRYGVYFKNSCNLIFEGCHFKNHARAFVGENGSVATFTKNRFEQCTEGIAATQGGCCLLFNENLMIGNAEYQKGLQFLDGNVKFYKDIFMGVQVMVHRPAIVEFNKCQLTAFGLKYYIGVYAGGTVTAANNRFAETGLYAVFMEPSANVTMIRNNYHSSLIAVGIADGRADVLGL